MCKKAKTTRYFFTLLVNILTKKIGSLNHTHPPILHLLTQTIRIRPSLHPKNPNTDNHPYPYFRSPDTYFSSPNTSYIVTLPLFQLTHHFLQCHPTHISAHPTLFTVLPDTYFSSPNTCYRSPITCYGVTRTCYMSPIACYGVTRYLFYATQHLLRCHPVLISGHPILVTGYRGTPACCRYLLLYLLVLKWCFCCKRKGPRKLVFYAHYRWWTTTNVKIFLKKYFCFFI